MKLTSLPLAALTPDRIAVELRELRLDELHALLSGRSSGRAAPALDALDLDGFAQTYIAALGTNRPIGGNVFAFVEQALVRALLERTGGNVSAAARLANVDRKKLERKVRKLRGKGAGAGHG